MILLYAILFIEFEAITEGLIKRKDPVWSEFVFEEWFQYVTAILLFLVWFLVIALPFDAYFVPVWKIITGFVLVRFFMFDVIWNVTRGVAWNYYGTTKLYDRIMTKLGGFGWFLKIICGIVGTCFLLGID